MSRIGKRPIEIPKGVDITISGDSVTVKGPKGTLSRLVNPQVKLVKEESQLNVSRVNEDRFGNSLQGLTRTLVSNMVKGVTEGFSKELQIVGVGYRAAM